MRDKRAFFIPNSAMASAEKTADARYALAPYRERWDYFLPNDAAHGSST
jgi:hypothetical protein